MLQAHVRRRWRSRSKRPCQMNIRASPCMCVRKLSGGLLLALKFTSVLCLVKASKDRCPIPPLPHALPLTFTVCICCDALVVGHVSSRVSRVFDERHLQSLMKDTLPTHLSIPINLQVECKGGAHCSCRMGGLLTSCPYAYHVIGGGMRHALEACPRGAPRCAWRQ